MALNIMRNGTPLDVLYGTKGASTAAATGCMQNGVDVNQFLLALADGKALGFNSGIAKNSADFSTIFGVPTGNTPLPINGNTYTAASSSGTGASSATLQFLLNSSGWQVNRTVSPNSGTGTLASGSIPTGAVNFQYVLTITSSTSGTSSTNGAPSSTPITGTAVGTTVTATSTPSTVENQIIATVQINFFNSSGVNISQTNITFNANATGAA